MVETIEADYFFNSPELALLNENYFSTSAVGSVGGEIEIFLFTPPQPSRYAIGYFTSKNTIKFSSIYYKKDQADFNRIFKDLSIKNYNIL